MFIADQMRRRKERDSETKKENYKTLLLHSYLGRVTEQGGAGGLGALSLLEGQVSRVSWPGQRMLLAPQT